MAQGSRPLSGALPAVGSAAQEQEKGGKTECKEDELLRDGSNRRAVLAGAVAAVIGDWVLSMQAWPDD